MFFVFVLFFAISNIVFAQNQLLLNSWFFWTVALFVILFFIIFWLAQNEFIDVPFLSSKRSGSKKDQDLVFEKQLENLPPAQIQSGFFEVSTENKPVVDDKIVLSEMKNKISEVKQSGLVKIRKQDEDENSKSSKIVDEILEEEFNKRRPEFRGEAKAIPILQVQREYSMNEGYKSGEKYNSDETYKSNEEYKSKSNSITIFPQNSSNTTKPNLSSNSNPNSSNANMPNRKSRVFTSKKSISRKQNSRKLHSTKKIRKSKHLKPSTSKSKLKPKRVVVSKSKKNTSGKKHLHKKLKHK